VDTAFIRNARIQADFCRWLTIAQRRKFELCRALCGFDLWMSPSARAAYYHVANAETLAAFGGSLSIGAVGISRTKVSSGMYWFVAITNAPSGRWIAARKTASLNFDFSIPRWCLGAERCQVK
jgi:hypothetical protein